MPEQRFRFIGSDLNNPDFYDRHSAEFIANTVNADMSAHRARFLSVLPNQARILDAGSGSGRDASAFREAGFDVSAFDASSAMVNATRQHAGVSARLMRFEEFEWEHLFEGIWACASLLHVQRRDLPDVLKKLSDHLVEGGVIYASFKLGGKEREEHGRYFNDMTEEILSTVLELCIDLKQDEVWHSPDRRPDRPDTAWLNCLLKKI